MPPTTIRECPRDEDFTELAEHQAQTPSTFYNAKPILHYKQAGVRALASRHQVSKLPVLGPGADGASQEPVVDSTPVLDEAMTVQSVDVWISSEYVARPILLSLECISRSLSRVPVSHGIASPADLA